jgi:hypothetical protein
MILQISRLTDDEQTSSATITIMGDGVVLPNQRKGVTASDKEAGTLVLI